MIGRILRHNLPCPVHGWRQAYRAGYQFGKIYREAASAFAVKRAEKMGYPTSFFHKGFIDGRLS